MKSFGVIAIVLASCLGSSLWAQQLKPEEKRALELKPAVVLVVVQFKTKWSLPGTQLEPIELQHTETGTGFLFRPDGYLITNGHVVADANLKDQQAREARDQQLKVELATALQNGEIAHWLEEKGIKLTDEQKDMLAKSFALWRITIEGNPTLKVILQNGNVLDPEILQYSPPIDQHGKDVAILKIPGSNLPTVKLGNSENVRLQDQIMVMGYPATASPFSNKSTSSLISMESGLEPSATNGHISALKVENTIGTPLLQSDVAIFHGNSGGPAFNDQGEVIGLATYGAQEAQGFNFLVPINTAMEFVRQSGVAPEVGSFNRHWAEALSLYDEGHCNRSTAEFDNVSQFMPGLRDAQKYRALAVDCVGQYEVVREADGKPQQVAGFGHSRHRYSGRRPVAAAGPVGRGEAPREDGSRRRRASAPVPVPALVSARDRLGASSSLRDLFPAAPSRLARRACGSGVTPSARLCCRMIRFPVSMPGLSPPMGTSWSSTKARPTALM